MINLLRKNKKSSPASQGFTLIEMMVAVSIFVIVAFIVVSTLLTMSYAYKKAQKMRLIMDNFNFALQSMSLNIREGHSYDISGDNKSISLKTIDGQDICYSLTTTGSGADSRGIIKVCNSVSCPCDSTGSKLSSPDINVSKLNFSLLNSDPAIQKKAVKIMIGGVAGTIPREQSPFFIQNTVSQRNVDN